MLVAFVIIGGLTSIQAQDRAYVNAIVKRLCASELHGRGYVKNGDRKASMFLADEMKKAGLKHFSNDYKQTYRFNVNTFPSKVQIKIDNMELVPGDDYVINPATATINQTFDLVWLPDTITALASVYQFVDTTALQNKMLVIPSSLRDAFRYGIPGVKALVQTVSGNMWWHVSKKQFEPGKMYLKINKEKLPKGTKTLHADIKNRFIANRPSNNVIGFVSGSVQPDSFMVFVAHYDHLGRMGKKTLFPGANDNASGTATVLDLARYYASQPEKAYYSMVFILVSGEEAGLMGSRYFAENSLFPLEKTKFVINLDMVGSGSEGLSVVNAKQFPEAFEIFDALNKQHQYFPDLRAGSESCNSDHCPFYEKGVPAVFLFTRGAENQHYHNTADLPKDLTFTAYEQLFGILTGFTEALQYAPSFRKK